MVRLETLLEKIQQTPLDLEYVRKRLPPRCRAVEYKTLKGKHRSEVFKETDALVVLIPKVGSRVGHFVVLLARGASSSVGHIEYFSSLGGTPEKELEKLGEPLSIFRELLGKNYVTNTKALQSGKYNVNDCAVWVLLRCFLRKMKLREFQGLFSRAVNLQTSDEIAAIMGVLLLVDILS